MEIQISISKNLANQYLSCQAINNDIQKIILYESIQFQTMNMRGKSPEWEILTAVIRGLDSGISECIYKHQNIEKICILRQSQLLQEIKNFKALQIYGNSTEWKGMALLEKKI